MAKKDFRKPSKFKPVTYKYAIETSTFVDAINILKEVDSGIADILGDATDLKTANSRLIDYYANNQAVLTEKKNIHSSLNIASNRATLKTENGYSFGWYVHYRIEKGLAVIETVEMTIVTYSEAVDAALYSVLEEVPDELKWEIVVK